uniref:Uncharacterized protein n=1 Tax=Clastoptera arizonana TaxID=38151 RepID=A0A1B6EF50_9HEMI
MDKTSLFLIVVLALTIANEEEIAKEFYKLLFASETIFHESHPIIQNNNTTPEVKLQHLDKIFAAEMVVMDYVNSVWNASMFQDTKLDMYNDFLKIRSMADTYREKAPLIPNINTKIDLIQDVLLELKMFTPTMEGEFKYPY